MPDISSIRTTEHAGELDNLAQSAELVGRPGDERRRELLQCFRVQQSQGHSLRSGTSTPSRPLTQDLPGTYQEDRS
jgi:hypothetical protein